jgi:HD-like signal output (HDOD) protein
MDIAILIFFVLLLVGAVVLFQVSRKKTKTGPKAASLKAGKPQKESSAEKPEGKPSASTPAPEGLAPWLERIAEARYASLPEGLSPASLEAVDKGLREGIEKRQSSVVPHPPTTLQLAALLRAPQTNGKEIAALAARDPILSARLLRAVNSAYLGLPQQVTSIGRAIVLLGYNNVKALLFEDVIKKHVPSLSPEEKERTDRVWIHSMAVSVCANDLGRNLFSGHAIDWATLGLLHDIGKYFYHLLERVGEADPHLPGLFQEEKAWGMNHAALGSLVARNWKLSEEIGTVIGLHHVPLFQEPGLLPSAFQVSVPVIAVADHLARVLGFEGDHEEILPLRQDVFGHLRLSPDLSALVTPALSQELGRVLTICEETGMVSKKETRAAEDEQPGQRERRREEEDDLLRIECPRCGYEAIVSRELLEFKETLQWVCPRCQTRVEKIASSPQERG